MRLGSILGSATSDARDLNSPHQNFGIVPSKSVIEHAGDSPITPAWQIRSNTMGDDISYVRLICFPDRAPCSRAGLLIYIRRFARISNSFVRSWVDEARAASSACADGRGLCETPASPRGYSLVSVGDFL